MPHDANPNSTPCPICKQPVDPASRDARNSPFPFCTPRCKLIDLGRWLGGKYQVPVVEHDESDDLPPDPAQP
jgi:endogenous inhibitor of DNA gyrase (YacG/DUF329 family)